MYRDVGCRLMGAWPRQCGFIFYLFPLVPLGFGEVDFGGFLVGLFGVVLAWGWELLGPVGGCQCFVWMGLTTRARFEGEGGRRLELGGEGTHNNYIDYINISFNYSITPSSANRFI